MKFMVDRKTSRDRPTGYLQQSVLEREKACCNSHIGTSPMLLTAGRVFNSLLVIAGGCGEGSQWFCVPGLVDATAVPARHP